MSAAKRHAIAARSQAIIAALEELWPHCFSVLERKRRPLKLHMHLDLIEACASAIAAGAVTEIDLRNALGSYTRNPAYLRQCKRGAARIDLNGKVCGSVTLSEAAHAKSLLNASRTTPKTKAPALPPPRSKAEAFKERRIKREYHIGERLA